MIPGAAHLLDAQVFNQFDEVSGHSFSFTLALV